MLGYIVSKDATYMSYIKRSSYVEDVTTENNWIFGLGVGDGIDIPNYVMVDFMQKDHSINNIQKSKHFVQ